MNPTFLTPTTLMINALLPPLLALIPDDIMQQGLDQLLDVIEDQIARTATPIDDALLLPLITGLRRKLQVPDND